MKSSLSHVTLHLGFRETSFKGYATQKTGKAVNLKSSAYCMYIYLYNPKMNNYLSI